MRGIFYRLFFATWTSLPKVIRYNVWCGLYRIGKKFCTDPTPGAQRLPFGMFLKRGWKARVQEGYATQFARLTTDIPVPTVIDILDFRGEAFIVVTALPGESLAELIPDMSDDDQLRVGEQLHGYMMQLRAVPPPSEAVSGFMGNPLYDDRISISLYPFDPFISIAEFHRFLVEHSVLAIPPEEKDVLQLIAPSYSRQHRICLTHGDFHPHNILIDERNNVSGIIDWECTGWLPEYWEYTRAQYIPWFRKGRWHRMISKVLPGYDIEYEAEKSI